MRIVLLAFLLMFSCGKSLAPVSGTTNGGVTLKGVPQTGVQKLAIEQGLLDTFVKARCEGYTQKLNLKDYTVVVEDGEKDSEGNPALRIGCGAYCGTQWDKGGYILIAGQVSSGEIITPTHTDAQASHLSLVVGYEAEHIILKANDDAKYRQTAVHGQGTGHPIIPECR